MSWKSEFIANISRDGAVSYELLGNTVPGDYLCMHLYHGRPETRRDAGSWDRLSQRLYSEIFEVQRGLTGNLPMYNRLGSAEALYGLRSILQRIREEERVGAWDTEGTLSRNSEFIAKVSSDGAIRFRIHKEMVPGDYLCIHAELGRRETRLDAGAWKSLQRCLYSEISGTRNGGDMCRLLGSEDALYVLQGILGRIKEEAGVWGAEVTSDDQSSDESSDDG